MAISETPLCNSINISAACQRLCTNLPLAHNSSFLVRFHQRVRRAKKKIQLRALKVQRGVRGLVDGQSFWTIWYTKRNETQHKKTSQPSIVTRTSCLSFSLGETSHDSLLTSPLCRMHSAKPRTFML